MGIAFVFNRIPSFILCACLHLKYFRFQVKRNCSRASMHTCTLYIAIMVHFNVHKIQFSIFFFSLPLRGSLYSSISCVVLLSSHPVSSACVPIFFPSIWLCTLCLKRSLHPVVEKLRKKRISWIHFLAHANNILSRFFLHKKNCSQSWLLFPAETSLKYF